jgi:hypothetical protein
LPHNAATGARKPCGGICAVLAEKAHTLRLRRSCSVLCAVIALLSGSPAPARNNILLFRFNAFPIGYIGHLRKGFKAFDLDFGLLKTTSLSLSADLL